MDTDIPFGPLSQPMPEAAHELLHPGEEIRHTGAISIHSALLSWRNGVIREQEIPRLRTGIPRIDRATRGLQPGELFGILARTGTGKTLLTSAIVDDILGQRPVSAVLTCNLEMPAAQLMGRTLRMHFRRPDDFLEHAARADTLDVDDFVSRYQNLYFLDAGAVSLAQIQRAAEDLQRQIAPAPLDCIVVDHCGLVRGGRSSSAYERADRHRDRTETTRAATPTRRGGCDPIESRRQAGRGAGVAGVGPRLGGLRRELRFSPDAGSDRDASRRDATADDQGTTREESTRAGSARHAHV